ncbi:MAG TPA: hypothetical protein VHL53_01900, partial [Acidimicrobiia bacterium]|nr:hypothetical protein [Acidimicrobiia bacterium]
IPQAFLIGTAGQRAGSEKKTGVVDGKPLGRLPTGGSGAVDHPGALGAQSHHNASALKLQTSQNFDVIGPVPTATGTDATHWE